MHTKQCSTESNCGYGNLLRIELETSRAGGQDKKRTLPGGEATQKICRKARLRPDSGACRFGYQGRGPRVRRSETRGAPVALRSAARDGRSLEKLGGHQRPEPHGRRKAACGPHRGSPDRISRFRGKYSEGRIWRGLNDRVG